MATRQSSYSLRSWHSAILFLGLCYPAAAKTIGGQDPKPACSCTSCCTQPSVPPLWVRSDTSSSVSRTEGNLGEMVSILNMRSGWGATIALSWVYNSNNADNSENTLDTVAGYGWTHSYNIFLFNQLGAMFRYDGDGRVTRYGLGTNGTYNTAPGYFETLTKTGATTFTITRKDQTVYTFNLVTPMPFLVGGPVYRLTQVQDRNGNTTALTYTSGNLTRITDTYGRIVTFTYNAANKVSSVQDPLGRVTTFQYDATNHKLTQITDPNGRSIQYTYNTLYQLTSKTDKAGRAFTYSYNSGFEPVAVYDSNTTSPATLSNPNNWATDPTQLAQNQLRVYVPSTATTTDGLGNHWQYHYDQHGYVLQQQNPDGSTIKYSYDPSTLQLSSVTDPNSNLTSYQYNSAGDLTQMTDALGHVTTYTYDTVFNQMLTMTDPRGRVTTYTLDAHGNRTQETDPLAQTRKWTYDSHGNVTQSVDKNGNVTTYAYDPDGNLTQQTEAVGTTIQSATQFIYNTNGNRTQVTDALGRVTQYQYDGMDRVIKETDAVGAPQQRTIQTVYDGEGNRTSVTDGRGIVTQCQYDVRQRLTLETDAVGTPQQRTIQTFYDGNDNRISVVDPLGRITQYQYDNRNRMIKETDDFGSGKINATLQWTYDPAGNTLSQTDANSHTTIYTYDALNRRTTMTDALSEKTRYFYDTGTFSGPVTLGGVTETCNQCGVTPGSKLVTEQVDPDGTASLHAGTTYFKYDALDRLVISDRRTGCIAGPSGTGCTDTINTSTDAVTLYTYDGVGNRLTGTAPDGNTTHDQYDARNRLVQETNAGADITTTTYDLVNNVSCVTAPDLNITCNSYDALNRVITVTDSVGLVATYTYDPDDNRISYGDGDGHVTGYSYDALNRMTLTTDPLGKTTTSAYDPVNNLLSVDDRNGNFTNFTYDNLNRRITKKDALNNVTQWTYDQVGNLITLTDADLHSTQYTYDLVNRPHCEIYADVTTRCYTYDPVGNLVARQDAITSQIVTYTYSDLYFLITRSYTPSGAIDTFTYDLSGRMLSNNRSNAAFSWPETFSYDGANRLTQSVENGRSINYSYNIPGRTRTVTYPGGRTITEHTDFRMRMDHIDDASSPPPIVQYTYDLTNNMLGRSYRNGTTSSYGYNDDNWMTSLTHSNGGGSFATFNYTYDNEGNKQYEQKLPLANPDYSECYGYDLTYRLVSYLSTITGTSNSVCPGIAAAPAHTQTSYVLDPVGNWSNKTTNGATQTRVHNSVNEITSINATPLTYDSDGDLTNDGTNTYQYDEEHRLTAVTAIGAPASAGQYQYDALGRRVQKIADASSSPVTTLYYYDGARIIEEQSGGVTQATYVYGNYIDEILTMARAGANYYYHQNQLWSVEAITDSSGNPVERYNYCGGGTLVCGDPYGAVSITDGSFNPIPPNTWSTPHSAIGNPWLFTGRQLDEETGLYHYRARSYDTFKGRFLQRDPMNGKDGVNPYEYVLSSPTALVDPNGWAPVNWTDVFYLTLRATLQVPRITLTGLPARLQNQAQEIIDTTTNAINTTLTNLQPYVRVTVRWQGDCPNMIGKPTAEKDIQPNAAGLLVPGTNIFLGEIRVEQTDWTDRKSTWTACCPPDREPKRNMDGAEASFSAQWTWNPTFQVSAQGATFGGGIGGGTNTTLATQSATIRVYANGWSWVRFARTGRTFEGFGRVEPEAGPREVGP